MSLRIFLVKNSSHFSSYLWVAGRSKIESTPLGKLCVLWLVTPIHRELWRFPDSRDDLSREEFVKKRRALTHARIQSVKRLRWAIKRNEPLSQRALAWPLLIWGPARGTRLHLSAPLSPLNMSLWVKKVRNGRARGNSGPDGDFFLFLLLVFLQRQHKQPSNKTPREISSRVLLFSDLTHLTCVPTFLLPRRTAHQHLLLSSSIIYVWRLVFLLTLIRSVFWCVCYMCMCVGVRMESIGNVWKMLLRTKKIATMKNIFLIFTGAPMATWGKGASLRIWTDHTSVSIRFFIICCTTLNAS